MASGVNANYGTMTKPLHAGHAARNGMAAAHARQGGLERERRGAGRPRRLLRDASRAAWPGAPSRSTISASTIRSGRSRLPAQALSVRRRHPHRHRRGAADPRRAWAEGRRHHRDQGRHLEICREPRRRGISGQHGGGEVQSAICRRGVAGERRAEARHLRAGGDQGRARQGAGRHGRRSRSIRSSPTRSRIIRRGSRSR